MHLAHPEPTGPAAPRAEVFLEYLDYFRSVLADKVQGLPEAQLRRSILPSGWTPLQLVKHLRYVELRWLVWGFEGQPVEQPFGDTRDDRWYIADDETLVDLLGSLDTQGQRTRAVVRAHELAEVGRPGPRWEGAAPPTLERVLFHLLQEYARHVGHLDVVRELSDGRVGE